MSFALFDQSTFNLRLFCHQYNPPTQYTEKVNVGGHVVADIGSSDLWISSGQSIADNTNTDVNLTYGIGLAYNNVAYTPVSFGGEGQGMEDGERNEGSSPSANPEQPYTVLDPGIGIGSECSNTERDFLGIAHLVEGLVEGNMRHQSNHRTSFVGNVVRQDPSFHSIGAVLEDVLCYAPTFITIGDYQRHLAIANKVDAILPAIRHSCGAKGSFDESQDSFAIAFGRAQNELSGMALLAPPRGCIAGRPARSRCQTDPSKPKFRYLQALERLCHERQGAKDRERNK
ncbi:hypothetical protein PAXINDRAFT_21931 [Paxillus involutus ATCC 200175]|uniref:Peptidase A1 domain-containing protein n=1 Tax=Paxillus involutus ATCC 200175 TaxID=664439 RepID=A0A0C9SSQ1_PAXIN|nr:hypothetical protein PAXINDRAFT_21931 [Paxillus involutus ATCC 200175]